MKQSSQDCEIQVQSLYLVYVGNITFLSPWSAIWKANLDLFIIAPILGVRSLRDVFGTAHRQILSKASA